ncbi:MAG TPA: DUF222 domain-containing protein [Streptosporangiaceae bacterium]
MPPEPVPADPGWDEDLAWLDRDPERESWLDRAREHDEPPLEEEYEDHAPLTAHELAEIEDAAGDELLAVGAAASGRRGPGQPGSARVFPGASSSPAAGFGPGMIFDVLPGCAQLAVAADAAAEEDRFAGISEAELAGIMCAWDRVEAHAAARKLAAIGELARRNLKPEDAEFTADQVACALGESRFRADELMGTAGHLDTHLPGTSAALRDGIMSLGKALIIATATGLLDPGEAAAAEAGVLDRAGRLTPGSLRAAIARAVMEAAPDKARKRRETAARFARVERWAEDSGNAALAGRELPPDEVLAPMSGSPPGRSSSATPGWRAAWTSCAPARSWTWSWARTPGPAPRRPRTPRATMAPPAQVPARTRVRPAVRGAGSPGGSP